MDPFSLDALADEHLALARQSPQGRSAHTVVGGRGHVLRHLLLALLEGQELADHESPGEATILVLRGQVTLGTAGDSCSVGATEMVAIPDERHNLVAVEDSVVVLTTAKLQK
jgi:quercetin dioxygenase-like cupin family protein